MGGTTDKVTGRAKQAIGGATGDRGLQREGRRDEFAGDVKRKGEELADAAKDAADRASEKVDDGVDRVRGRD